MKCPQGASAPVNDHTQFTSKEGASANEELSISGTEPAAIQSVQHGFDDEESEPSQSASS